MRQKGEKWIRGEKEQFQWIHSSSSGSSTIHRLLLSGNREVWTKVAAASKLPYSTFPHCAPTALCWIYSLDLVLAPIYYALFAPARWSEKYLVGLLILLRLFLVLPELHWTGAQIRDKLQKEERYKYMNILCKYYLLSWAELACAN